VVLDASGVVVARAFAVSFAAGGGHSRADFPDHGWEAVLIWAAEDRLDGCHPDTAAAVTVTVAPDRRGLGISTVALRALARAAREAGLRRLICPVRPGGKAREPTVPMKDYAARTRADGLPTDPWLRAHVRAGGVISRIAPFAMTVQGTLEQWRGWTGKAFDQDGLVVVDGALVPVIVSAELDCAVYVEPNVWAEYNLAD
jgi:GNAT superfamily N-acetyltransferase